MPHTALGPAFSDAAIADTTRRLGLSFIERDDISATVADLLADGKVVGWFQGAMEGGPRALGHRSILASPESGVMRNRVNDMKHRSRWRPLGPSLPAELAGSILEEAPASPFMIVAATVKEAARNRVPAVVHVDGSTRPQAVDRLVDPMYWSLLDAFEARTGLPCVINTSLNDDAEPIACRPMDAISTFFSTGLDVLALGRFVLDRKG